jgi:hypothetical protein
MSANPSTTTKRGTVRIRIKLKAYLRFSQQIDEQLERLEDQMLAAMPQLANRKPERGPVRRG